MRRTVIAFLAVTIGLLLAVGSVAADTSPNGTNFSSSSSSCSTAGSRTVCTDTNLYVFSNEDGSAGPPCLEVFKYASSSNGRFTVISDEFGCASGSDTVAIGTDLSVAISATQIPLDNCNRRTCSPSRTVTVSASDSPTGPISTTTTRSTTKSGTCTTRTTTTDEFADLAGTMTIDGTVFDQTGFVDVFTSTSTTHCK
jgi:hypothetical protein